MNLCRLIFVIVIGLIMSPDAFAGKGDDEKQGASTAQKLDATPEDDLLDALSTVFETEDHHEPRNLSYKPLSEGVNRGATYGDRAPLNVAPILRQRALNRIFAVLKEKPALLYDVISKQDEYLVGHYCQHLDQSLKLWVLPLTRAVWAALPDEESKELMVQAYANSRVLPKKPDEKFRQDLIENTPYRNLLSKPEKNKRVKKSPRSKGNHHRN